MTGWTVMHVAEGRRADRGNERPIVYVPSHVLDELDAGYGSTVELRVLGFRDPPLVTFIESDIGGGLAAGTCALSSTLADAFPRPPSHLEAKPCDAPAAAEIGLGHAMVVHHSRNGPREAPAALAMQAAREVIPQLMARKDLIHVGAVVEASAGDGNPGVTVSHRVVDLKPGLVARIAPGTKVAVKP